MKPEEKQAIDGLVQELVDCFSAGSESAAWMADDWRRTLERGGLDLSTRLLAAIAGAASLSQGRILKPLAAAACRAGVSPEALSETLLFLVPYCGWAAALNALPALAEGGRLEDPLAGQDREALRRLGHEKAREVNPQFEKVAENLAARDPVLLDHLTETAYGAVYGRPGLDLRTRELIAVVLLTISGQEPQLKYHVRGALNVGASAEELREIMVSMHLLAGWPVTLAALEVMESVVSAKKRES